MYQWKGSVTYFMHPVDHVLSFRLIIREINTLKTSFAIYALYYLQYKKNLVSISKNGEKVNQDNLHTHKQGITTQLFLANFLLKGIEITVCKLQTIVFLVIVIDLSR